MEEMESVPNYEDVSINPPLVAEFLKESIFSAKSSKKHQEEQNIVSNRKIKKEEPKEEMKVDHSISQKQVKEKPDIMFNDKNFSFNIDASLDLAMQEELKDSNVFD